jgi:hypothetical protein
VWALTALLALGAGALVLSPAGDRYRASAVVEVGPSDVRGLAVTTLEYDAQQVTRPDSLRRVVDTVLRSEVLRAHLTATASSRETAVRRVRDAAELVRATAAARSNFDRRSSAPRTVKVSTVQEETIAGDRPAGRVALAAIILVLVLAAADALFLTRARLPLTLPDAPKSAPANPPAPEPVALPVPQPATAAASNRRRYPRRRRERVAASPLDLPNLEVHLLDREGGLRSIQLRDAAGAQAANAPYPREQ